MRSLCLIVCLWVCGAFVWAARGDSFQLTTGETVTGELLPGSANEDGVQIKVGEGDYKRVLWTSFSQDDLKKFSAIPKLGPLVEPYIEISPQEKRQRTEVNLKTPTRLERPQPESFFGALFGSALGVFIVFLVYAANVYAGYEVAIFRAQPPPLVCGLSAIPGLGFAVPIIYLCLPTRMPARTEEEAPAEGEAAAPVPETAGAAGGPATSAAGAEGGAADNPMAIEGAAHPSGLRLAHAPEPAKQELPPATTFQRGQFTFNRRFFETKFSGFFAAVRRDAERDMVLLIRSARGEYVGQRITRIAANDLHLLVQKGPASEEVTIPFVEIKEIVLKHKDA